MALSLLVAIGAAGAQAQDGLPTAPLVIESGGVEHLFRAEIAANNEDRSRGLMFRERLDKDAGMLFIYDSPRRASFWMRNTLIPLDMLFIDTAGIIVAIAAETVPLSEEPISPPQIVEAVFEINGGLSEALGIEVGDRIRTPALN